MKKLGSNWLAVAALVTGLVAASSANATWTFGGVDGGAATTSVGADATGVSITNITGAYAANGGTLTAGALGTSIVANTTYGINGYASAATAWATNSSSNLQYYSGGGLGMASDSTLGTAPNHALDNGPATNSSDKITGLGNTESVLMSFSSSVILNNISLGYVSGDADISLFRYTGSSAPSLAGTGASLASMQAAGWELVGNYGSTTQSATNAVNSGSLGSSWWLVSAYNTAYGAATSGTVDQGDDFFKVAAVAGSKCTGTSAQCGGGTGGKATPEPASLALVGVALLGMYGTRRRKAVIIDDSQDGAAA